MDDYENMGTGELRKLIRERGLGSGLALSSANKETCVSLLKGEITWDELKARVQQAPEQASASSGASTCQQSAGTAAPNADAMAQVMAGLAALMPAQKVDMEEVRRLAVDAGHDAAVNAVEAVVRAELDARLRPTRVELVKRETGEAKNLGVCHKAFPSLLALCQVREADGMVPPVYLYGPAGTGKTTAARKVAESLGLPFHYNGAIGCAYEVTGYNDAQGRFVETPFYKAYTQGGVYLFDELDSSNPNAVLAFNAALANGHASFACGNAKRHPDSIIIAAGNTDMRGAKDGFGGRLKMDASFRDRFVYLEWAIDEALEQAIADSYGDEWGWCGMVRRWRARAAEHGIRDFEVTPRATGRGLAMLKAGVPMDLVVQSCVRKALGDDAWRKVNG